MCIFVRAQEVYWISTHKRYLVFVDYKFMRSNRAATLKKQPFLLLFKINYLETLS